MDAGRKVEKTIRNGIQMRRFLESRVHFCYYIPLLLPETHLFIGKIHFSGDHLCVAPGGRRVGSLLARELRHVRLPQLCNRTFVLEY